LPTTPKMLTTHGLRNLASSRETISWASARHIEQNRALIWIADNGAAAVDALDVVRACFRQKFVVLALMVIVAWIVFQPHKSAKPAYYSDTIVGMAPSNLQWPIGCDGAPAPKNGLLDIGGEDLVTSMAVYAFNQPSVKGRVVAGGGTANFFAEAVKTFDSAGKPGPEKPLIRIEAIAEDPHVAQNTAQLAAAEADHVLGDIQQQAGVPDEQMVKAITIAPASVPVTPMQGPRKLAIYRAMIGITIVIFVSVGIDSILTRRRRRKENTGEGPSSEDSLSEGKEAPADTATDRR
jgi:hypothetical protein